jgi:small GTP-binding protein
MKITTTVEKLDEALKGGIKEGSNVLVVSDMMIDKARFGMNILSGILTEQVDNGFYFVNNKFPDFVREGMRNWSKIRNKVHMIDGFSYTAGKRSREEFQVKMKTTDIDSYTQILRSVIMDAFHKKGKKRSAFVFDSLDYWIGKWNLMETFIQEFRSKRSVSYYLLADVGLGEREIKRIGNNFDYVIFLKAMEKKGLVFKHIDVEKPSVDIRIPFEMTLSGISIYVPKILVIGPFHAGKSTLIKALSQKPTSVDRLGTTVALDHGWVERNGFAVDLFGSPGQQRFDWILNTLAKSVIGIFLVMDSTKPDYKRAREILDSIKHRNLPVVILANKQDIRGAEKPKNIEKKLGYPAIGTVAIKKKGCEEALERIFNEILRRESWYRQAL